MKKKLFVIDGHALCYRAYYAFIRNPLMNREGQNVSAIFGFARMLYKLVEEQKPDYLAVAFDPPKKSFRYDLYEEYKANRRKMPDDLRSQIDEIKSLVTTLGLTQLENDTFEADDILGSVAGKYGSEDVEVVLVTGDKDAYQLVNEHVRIYANKKGISEYEIYDADAVKDKLGITPDQVIDYMALMGDTSDNIPGVKGVGEKSAQKLIQAYGSLDSIYEHLEEIKGKQKELLRNDKENAYLSKKLVTIDCSVPLDLDLAELTWETIYSEQAKEYFQGLEMASIVNDLFGESGEIPQNGKAAVERKYVLVQDLAVLRDAIAEVRNAGEVSIDTETTGVNPVDAEIVGLSFSVRPHEGWYVPLVSGGLFGGQQLDAAEAIKLLKPVLEDSKIRKIGQNIKYDIIIFRNRGIQLRGVYFDTMIASYLLNPGVRRHNMDDLAEQYLGYKTTTYKELVGTGKNALAITEVPLDKLADYAIEDTDITLQLYHIFKPKLEEHELADIFYNLEMPLVSILSEMEYNGVKIDTVHFQKLAVENEAQLKKVEESIYENAEQTFNINSTRELAHILFEKLGLKPQKKTKTGYSTDISVLEALKGDHPIIEHLIGYRTFSKLKNTYIDTLPKLISPKTNRIHTSYNQTVAATGRLSSSDPNLQNIPVRDEFGKKIRKGFVAEKGSGIMAADYSQIELRLAAHISKDANMIKAFREGIDIHNLTASSVYGVDINDVQPDMRRHAKIINFATIYGVSPFGLSQQAEISVKEAAEFIRIYFETYPGFKRYIDETIAFAKEHGYVQTVMGRKRPIPEINSDTTFRREGAERIAINTPIQGTSADMIKQAMIVICKDFAEYKLKSRMIMQVHDELVFEVPDDERGQLEQLVRAGMENALKLDLPVVVDIGWGRSWEEAH